MKQCAEPGPDQEELIDHCNLGLLILVLRKLPHVFAHYCQFRMMDML